jgi:hypothetical protein
MSQQTNNKTHNKSFITIMMGLFAMMIASFMFYYDVKSYVSYLLFATGFVLVGVGLLFGFLMLIRDGKNAR